ncbi:MAG: NAD(P)/FAD-dependent oxidoreductase, partial [Myxococcales bacterium]|nr:NAD(P)/FAD-dependent oxidoreductase [Myxococcales bacterium]
LTSSRRVSGVRLSTGEEVAADAVVFAGDQAALANGRLGEAAQAAVRPVPARGRSLSAVTWCIHGTVEGWPLAHHNVVFGDDYAEEFDAIFKRRALPRTPTVYVCAQDVGDGVLEHAGAQRLLVLVNAPADGDGHQTIDAQTHLNEEDVQACEARTFEHLRRCGLTVQHQPHQTVRTDPRQWERLFPGSGGGLYGQADHSPTASLRRMGARTRLSGLYLCGGTVHPGAGVPMAALSGMMASAQLHADRPSTALFLPAATLGGTATSSATTAPAT